MNFNNKTVSTNIYIYIPPEQDNLSEIINLEKDGTLVVWRRDGPNKQVDPEHAELLQNPSK
jgi:hypothetical protein